MATTTKARSRRKPERRIRLSKPIRDGMGALQITIGGEPHNDLIYRPAPTSAPPSGSLSKTGVRMPGLEALAGSGGPHGNRRFAAAPARRVR